MGTFFPPSGLLSRLYSRQLGRALVATRTIISGTGGELKMMGLLQGGKLLKMFSKYDLICDISGLKNLLSCCNSFP